MSTGHFVSQSGVRGMMGSMRNAASTTDIVEVSEDSSSEDQDHRRLCRNINKNAQIERISRTTRKARRNSLSRSSGRGTSTDRKQQKLSYPGGMESSDKYNSKQQMDDDEDGLDASVFTNEANTIARGGVSCPFPWKLHEMLEFCCSGNNSDPASKSEQQIVAWNEAGTAFAVLDAKTFVQTILPRYVRLFQRLQTVALE